MGVIMIKSNVYELSVTQQVLRKGLFYYCGDNFIITSSKRWSFAINFYCVKYYWLSFVILYKVILK